MPKVITRRVPQPEEIAKPPGFDYKKYENDPAIQAQIKGMKKSTPTSVAKPPVVSNPDVVTKIKKRKKTLEEVE